METLFQVLTLLVTIHGNIDRDRCAQLDTMRAGETAPDMIGLEICGTGPGVGTIYTGAPRASDAVYSTYVEVK